MTFRTFVLLIFQANWGTKLFHQRMIHRITLFDFFTNENKLGCFIITRDLKIWIPIILGSKFRRNSGRNSGSRPKSGIFGHGVAGITFIKSGVFRQFLIKETEMRHRCDSRIINYLTLMTLKTPEMTGTKSKFWSKFRFRLDSVPATGRNFAGILNLGKDGVVGCVE
jgi:hypothetical protein